MGILTNDLELSICSDYKTLYPALWKVAKAIQLYEGWFSPGEHPSYPNGSVSWRNNNPGNLVRSTLSKESKDGFAVFGCYHAGLHALLYDLTSKCLGRTTTGLGPNSTILDLFRKYAPEEDGNDPDRYAAEVAAQAGLHTTSKLSKLLE